MSELTNPEPLIIEASVFSNYNNWHISKCNISDGEIKLEFGGDFESVTVIINGGNYGTITENELIVSNLGEGIYNIKINSEKGCEASTTIELIAPECITAKIAQENCGCYGDNSAKIIVSEISGGIGDYINKVYRFPYLEEVDFQNLTAGTYKVVITDKNGGKYSE